MPSELDWPFASPMTVVVGPARSGKTNRLLEHYRLGLRRYEPGACLWLAPTTRSAADIRARLPGPTLPACLSPGVMTFDRFAGNVLRQSAEEFSPLSPVLKRQLLQRLIAEADERGELRHFGPIAGTAGFIDLLAEFISDLKRHEVWPEQYHAACHSQGAPPKDRDLALLYERYQECLNQGQLYDAEGRFWWARTLLRDSPDVSVAAPKLIVADGFTDFTHTQHEILEVLAARADWLLISLPLDEPADRPELFRKAHDTLAQFKQRHPELQLAVQVRTAGQSRAIFDHVERQLFRNPRAQAPAADGAGIEIGAAAGELGEVRWIARTIKRLLLEGDPELPGQPVRPGEIAVACRGLQAIGPAIEGIFAEYGLPLALEAAPTLDRVPALAALLSLIQLEAEDWPIDSLLALITNTYFRPAWRNDDRAIDVDWIVRELQIPQGSQLLRESVARHAATEIESDPAGELSDLAASMAQRRRRERRRRASGALPLLEALAKMLSKLPSRATGAVWAEALAEMAREIHFEPAQESAAATRDGQAWNRLLAALAAEDQLSRQLALPPRELDQSELLELLHDLCRWEHLPGGGSEAGHVRVLSAVSVRGLTIPYLFVAGLSESSFPQHRGAQFHAASEIEQLREAGLRFDPHHDQSEDEMLLFYEVVTRATRRLYLSYPALDESAQQLLPSPYLTEVERACGPGKIVRHEQLPGTSIIPAGSPLSAPELRIRAVSDALQGEPRLLAAILRAPDGPGGQLSAGWRANLSRADREVFGPFEGMLLTPGVHQRLAQEFNAERPWNASELELYAYCPFRFLMAKTLGIEPLADLRLDIDASNRGRLMHEVLANVYRRRVGRDDPPASADPERFRHDFTEVLAEELGKDVDQSPLAAAWRTIDRQVLLRWCDNYLAQAADYERRHAGLDEPPRPAYFEVSFGIPDAGQRAPSTALPLRLEHAGESLLLRGRIDRIDLAAHDGRYLLNIVDYKSGAGGAKPARHVAPTALQADLYSLAAAELLLSDLQATPFGSGYWYLRSKGYEPTFENNTPEAVAAFAARRAELINLVLDLAAGVRRGEFPVSSAKEDCTGQCHLRTVCRVNQVRSLEKVWRVPPRAGN